MVPGRLREVGRSGQAICATSATGATQVKMVESMARGTFVTHHLEPSYYQAMLTALNTLQQDALDEIA